MFLNIYLAIIFMPDDSSDAAVSSAWQLSLQLLQQLHVLHVLHVLHGCWRNAMARATNGQDLRSRAKWRAGIRMGIIQQVQGVMCDLHAGLPT